MGNSVRCSSHPYYDRTGETFVRAWRATGTRDPATLALLGLHAAELAFLAADEGPA